MAAEPREFHEFENMALADYATMVLDLDENVAFRLLALIGNQARWLVSRGEPAMKLQFAAEVCERFRPYIEKWAEEKVELAKERT